MDFNEYQNKAKETAFYPNIGSNYIYPVLGLVGEAGEVAEKIKKLIREKEGKVSEMDKEEIKKEIGDVLWYIAVFSDELGIKLDDVATLNVEKLASRKKRGKLHGSGDNR